MTRVELLSKAEQQGRDIGLGEYKTPEGTKCDCRLTA